MSHGKRVPFARSREHGVGCPKVPSVSAGPATQLNRRRPADRMSIARGGAPRRRDGPVSTLRDQLLQLAAAPSINRLGTSLLTGAGTYRLPASTRWERLWGVQTSPAPSKAATWAAWGSAYAPSLTPAGRSGDPPLPSLSSRAHRDAGEC
jgi:hypothetical protein